MTARDFHRIPIIGQLETGSPSPASAPGFGPFDP
jgi:hypothetical protein